MLGETYCSSCTGPPGVPPTYSSVLKLTFCFSVLLDVNYALSLAHNVKFGSYSPKYSGLYFVIVIDFTFRKRCPSQTSLHSSIAMSHFLGTVRFYSSDVLSWHTSSLFFLTRSSCRGDSDLSSLKNQVFFYHLFCHLSKLLHRCAPIWQCHFSLHYVRMDNLHLHYLSIVYHTPNFCLK